jgi:hypothetical protein
VVRGELLAQKQRGGRDTDWKTQRGARFSGTELLRAERRVKEAADAFHQAPVTVISDLMQGAISLSRSRPLLAHVARLRLGTPPNSSTCRD